MKTIFISGSNTGVGKTHVTGLLANELAKQHLRVQIVKPVQTGIIDPNENDALMARNMVEESCRDFVDYYTLFSFQQSLSPLTAAKLDGKTLSINDILKKYEQLPTTDYRIIEGAGGIAVPLDESGADWVDFIAAIQPQLLVLVIENKLGAINQARLTWSYVQNLKMKKVIFLNEITPQSVLIQNSNKEGFMQSHIAFICEEKVVLEQQDKYL